MKNIANVDIRIKTSTGEKFEIPLQGSLGLLALGDVGLMMWREKKKEAYQKANSQTKLAE